MKGKNLLQDPSGRGKNDNDSKGNAKVAIVYIILSWPQGFLKSSRNLTLTIAPNAVQDLPGTTTWCTLLRIEVVSP